MSKEYNDREQFEAFVATPEGRSLYAEFGVKTYADYLRVPEQMEQRQKQLAFDLVDAGEWMTDALKRAAVVEAELRTPR